MKRALQRAVVARLVADAGVKAIVAKPSNAPAVYAPKQPFPDVFPRVTIDPPQTVPSRATSTDEVFFTLHSWAKGGDAALVVVDLADALRAAIIGDAFEIDGLAVRVATFEGDHDAGDPDETVAHLVSTFRFLVSPSA